MRVLFYIAVLIAVAVVLVNIPAWVTGLALSIAVAISLIKAVFPEWLD